MNIGTSIKSNTHKNVRKRIVRESKPSYNNKVSFTDEDQQKQKMITSSMRAREMLLRNCQGFSASVVNTKQVEKSKFGKIPAVWDFLDVFYEELPRLSPNRAITLKSGD